MLGHVFIMALERNLESHKHEIGGKMMRHNDCMVTLIQGSTDEKACISEQATHNGRV